MNQGKLDVVKQEMVRININIVGISELKWMGMGEIDSDDHYTYYCGHESHRRNEVTLPLSEGEMAGWHHRCNGHELGQTPGDDNEHGGLVCYSPWGHKELDMTGN